MIPAEAKEKLVVALDYSEPERVLDIVRHLNGNVGVYKIGIELLWRFPDIIYKIAEEKNQEINLFIDAKLFDIPRTVEAAARQIAQINAKFLTVYGDPACIRPAAQAARGSQMKILAVTALTSQEASLGQVCDMAAAAQEAGADGVIASAREAKAIREQCGKGFLIVTPGIRPAGAPAHHHRRTATPAQAIRAGADYLVVGRPILDADRPVQAAQEIVHEMSGALAARQRVLPAGWAA